MQNQEINQISGNIGVVNDGTARRGSLEHMYITETPGLDPINVFWINLEPGQGHVTITCYGSAWTAYFGAMGAQTVPQTIQQFFASVNADYMVTKLACPMRRQTKREEIYLTKIFHAVKAALKETGEAA